MDVRVAIGTAGLIVCAAAASAQGRPGMGAGHGPGTMMSVRDTDGDGFIGKAEHTAWVADVFKTMDSNGDGRLSRDEYMVAHMGPGPHGAGSQSRMAEMRARAGARKAEQFASMDGDKDGQVTRDQFLANADGNFAGMDSNKDGKVSTAEFRNWHRGL